MPSYTYSKGPWHNLVTVFFIITLKCYGAVYNETALKDIYGGVDSWDSFSPRFDISQECLHGRPVRFAYFTRHTGTLWDWTAIANHLGVPWTRVNPGSYSSKPAREKYHKPYASDEQLANALWADMGPLLCHVADVLVFCDIIPDSRPVLQNNCTTPIILQVTNRFDFDVRDIEWYYQLMADVAKRPHVWWVCNNPYDEMFLRSCGVDLPKERTRVLRPVGASMLEWPELPPESAATIAFLGGRNWNHLEVTFLGDWIKSQGLESNVTFYGNMYGGPGTLAQHRAAIHVPYQASVMKMYEGLTVGAVFIIPSPTLFESLHRSLNISKMFFCCRHLFDDYPNSWWQYVEWYNPIFRDAHIMYDSWEDLADIIRGSPRYPPSLFESKKRLGREIMAHMRNVTLQGYSEMYAAIRQQTCQSSTQPDALSQGMRARSGP